jgi:hypothetical protein
MKKRLKHEEKVKLVQRMRKNPVWFWRQTFKGKPWSKQLEILNSVWKNKITAARSCHGAGKSWTAARVGITYLMAWPSIVVTTAPTGRQVRMILWQEWALAVNKAKKPLGGRLLTVEHKIADGWYAFGFATDVPDNFQGLHGKRILVIVDEAAGIEPKIFAAIESLLTSENARLLCIGNPTDPDSNFAKLFSDPKVGKIHISAFDTPNFTTFGITEADFETNTWEERITGPLPYPELVTPAWAYDKYVKWGPDSPDYIARVKGQFPEAGENVLIPLTWVELAMQRWADMAEGEPREMGVDVARFGMDESALAPRAGRKVISIQGWHKHDLMETAGWVKTEAVQLKMAQVKVDVIGMGAGVVDRLNEQRRTRPGLPFAVEGIDVSKAPKNQERFFDLTSELWWNIRDMLDPNPASNPTPIGLPPDEDLLGQLTSRRYTYTSTGKVRLESKDDIKKRGLSSPDRADAVVLAFAQPLKFPSVIGISLEGTSKFKGR